jgi:co-chaperonin GroES (HSP10)
MIQPLRDRILVKPIERTKSDILAVIMQENF